VRYSIFIILFFQIGGGCGHQDIIDSHAFRMNGSWDFEHPVETRFSYSENENLKLSLSLTHTDGFPYKNIYLRSTLSLHDTIQEEINSYPLQNDLGQWLGSKKGESYNINLLLFNRIEYDPSGIDIKIEQYTREDKLKGVEFAKIIIEKAD